MNLMNNELLAKLSLETDIIPGKVGTKVKLTVLNDKLIVTKLKTKESYTLYYNYFDCVELGIYKGVLLLQTKYHGNYFNLGIDKKTWSTNSAVSLLKNINKYTPILDPIKYYKVVYTEPKILHKKDFADTLISVIIDDINAFKSNTIIKNAYDKDMMIINLTSFLIKRYIEEKQKDKAISTIKELVSYIIEINKKYNNLDAIIVYNIELLARINPNKDELKEYDKLALDLVKINLEKENTYSSEMLVYDFLYELNFERDLSQIRSSEEVNYLIDNLEKLAIKSDDYYHYYDLCQVLLTIFMTNKIDLKVEGNLEKLETLIKYCTLLTTRSNYYKNYAYLAYAYAIKFNYYEETDLLEARDCINKEKDAFEKAISLSKLPTKKTVRAYLERNQIIEKDELNFYNEELAICYVKLCNISFEYNNMHDQITYLRKALEIKDKLLTDNYYKDLNSKEVKSILDEYFTFIEYAFNDEYEDFPFLGACTLRYFTLTKKLLEKEQTEELYKHLVHSANEVIKFLCFTDGKENEKDIYLNEMLEGAKKLHEFNKDNQEASDAKTFVYYSFFRKYENTNIEEAKNNAKLVLDNIYNIDKDLLDNPVYQGIIKRCSDYLEENK